MIETIFACDPVFLESNLAFFFSMPKPLTLDDITEIDGSTFKLKIKGPLYDAKYDLILEALALADDQQIKNVDLLIDSPGGTVNKMDLVWQAINAIAQSKKVTAYNMGTMASAAYFIGSAASKIVAMSPTAITGSIGVVVVATDKSKAEEMSGFRTVIIPSSNAEKKVPDFSEEGIKDIQARVDAYERVMFARIAEGRNTTVENIKENYGRGDVFIAKDPQRGSQDALKRGMIDSVIGKGFTITKPSANNKPDKGVRAMKTLDEYFAEDPKLERLVEKALEAKALEARAEVREELQEIAAFLDGEYPRSIKAQLVEAVRKGGKIVDRAIGAVTVYDSLKAEEAVRSAVTTTEATPEIAAAEVPQPSADGQIRNDVDVENAIAELRGDVN